MKIKMLFPFLLLLVGVLFTACEQETEFEPISQTEAVDVMEARDKIPAGPNTNPGCKKGRFEAADDCDCQIRITSVSRVSDEWRLTLLRGGQVDMCCISNTDWPNYDVQSDCGTDSFGSHWQDLKCGLVTGENVLRFISSAEHCDGAACDFPENSIGVQVRCGNSLKTLNLIANDKTNCESTWDGVRLFLNEENCILEH